jgi:hypothetical protein
MANLVELTNFIVSLSENPQQARRFREDPDAVIEESDVSEETKNLLRGGRANVTQEIRASLMEPSESITHVVTHTHTHIHTHTNVVTNVVRA